MSAEPPSSSGTPGDEPARRRRRRRRRRTGAAGETTEAAASSATPRAPDAPGPSVATPRARAPRAPRDLEPRAGGDVTPRSSSGPIASKWVWLALGFWAGYFVVVLPEGVARAAALLIALGSAVLLAATYRRWVRAQLDEARARRAQAPRR